MKIKKIIAGLLVATTAFSLAACGNSGSGDTKKSDADTSEKKEIVYGKSQGPYTELFEDAIVPILEKEGYTLKAVDLSDLQTADVALNDGDVDVNVEQHTAYMDNFNKSYNADLVAISPIPTVPAGVYSEKYDSVDEIPDGAKVAVPNDASNTARCYLMLQKIGWIKLDENADPSTVTQDDIVENPHFVSLLTMFKNPFMGILVGIAFTAVLQSASASVGILQALSITGSITFAAALPITMGIGVGAACPVLLSSIGTNKNGKRTALIYLLNDLFGMIFWSIVFYSVNAVVHFTFMDMVMSPVSIALLNSVFRIATILILAPFISKIEKLVFFLIKDTDEDNEEQADFDLLEERFLDYPPLAISQSQMAVNGMAKNARKNLMRAFELLTDFSDSKFNKIQEKENMIDKYEDKLGTYLMQLSMHDMTPDQAKQTSKFLHTISDFERLGDHAVNISRVAQELHEKSRAFSESATYELNVLEKALVEIVDLTVNSFVDEDLETAAKVEPLRELIGILCNDLKLRHIKRLRNGQCDLNTGFAFNDLLTNYERIAAHCSNIAVAILELDSSNFDIHEYTKSVRKLKDETYLTAFEEYEKKYDINGYQPEAEADKKSSAKVKDSEKDKDSEKSSGKKKDKDKKKDKKK